MIKFNSLRNLSIKNKIIGIILLVTFISLSTGFFIVASWDINRHKSEIQSNLALNARLVGNTCIVPLAFGDNEQASVALSALLYMDNIEAAYLYDKEGQLFSNYPDSLIDAELLVIPEQTENMLVGGYFYIHEPVIFQNEKVGTLFLKASSQALVDEKRTIILTLSLLVLLLSILSVFITSKMQRFISTPIIALKNHFDSVAESQDFTQRIQKFNNDEIGDLFDEFNYLTNQIQNRSNEKKDTETALRESEEKYRLIVENANDGIEISQDDKIIYSNTQFANLLGYSVDEIKGLSFERVFTKQAKRDLNERRRVEESEGILTNSYEADFCRKDKSIIDVEVKYEIIEFKGKPATFAIVRDITERKQAEMERLSLEAQLRQSQKLEAVGTMAGGIAHDFNNILQGLYLYSDIIKNQLKDGDEGLKLNFNHIIESSQRAKELVKQILTFSRKEDTDLRSSKIQYLLKDVLKLIRASTPTTIAISEDIDVNCGPVLCDSTQLHQVFVNLCNNAVHALNKKGGTLSVSLKEIESHIEIESGKISESEMGVIELIVADTGQGMDAKTLELIFDPFFTTKPVGEGTGLGLSIVHGIIKDMNGQITVVSKPGQGSTFRILMPISTKKMVEEGLVEPDEGMDTLRILFVDDDEMISRAGKLILEQKGHKVTVAGNGHKALELFQKDMQAYDLIITDLTMPQMTGLELCKAVRKLSPDVLIILTSGNLDPQLQIEYESFGFNGFVRKPWMASEMLKVVGSLKLN